jgi:hypothetical protein
MWAFDEGPTAAVGLYGLTTCPCAVVGKGGAGSEKICGAFDEDPAAAAAHFGQKTT